MKKMNLMEFLTSTQDLFIHCKTLEEAKQFFIGREIITGGSGKNTEVDKYGFFTKWHEYKENTCYSNRNYYTQINDLLLKNVVLEFEDIDWTRLNINDNNNKITFKQFWDSPEEMAIHCRTEEQEKTFYRESIKLGKKKCNGQDYRIDNILIDMDIDNLCLSNKGQFGDRCFYEEDKIKVLEFYEINWEE